jgi:6-phosphogluconolactonase
VRWATPGDAAAVADRIAAELAKPGEKRLAMTGGSTPLKVFALLKIAAWTGAAPRWR